MRRPGKIAAWTGGALLLCVAVLIVLIATFDWNRIKPWLNDKVSEASGRPFEIQGDLELSWQRQKSEASGWRAWVPWPHFSADQVMIGNPEWAKAADDMGRVKQIEFSLNPLALPSRQIEIPTLVLTQPDLVLERRADGRNNWTFKRSDDERGKWQLELGRIKLEDGRLRIVDAIRRADITAELSTFPQPDEDGHQMQWSVKGKLEGEAVQGKGLAGPLLALREQDEPYPIEGDLKVGKTKLSAKGTVTRPRSLAAVDVQLELSGPSMAKLYPITTVVLPETPPYSTTGHLKGQINDDGGHWEYRNFTGKVGASDLSGTLAYRAGQPRARLEGTLQSKLLKFEDLGALIGSRDGADRKGKSPVSKSGKVLPDKKFRTDRWTTLDADVKFTGRKILRSADLPVEDLQTHLKLDNGVLTLDPLQFGVAGGKMTAAIRLNGREPQIKATMKVSARGLRLNRLMPAVEEMRGSIGAIHGDAQLSGTGDSVATLLGSSNGEVKALIDRGSISKFVLEAIGLNIGSVVITQLFGDRQVNINCMVSDFAVNQGLMKTRVFVIDTEDAVINVSGQINLAREQLDLVINPESRNMRLFSLRSPLYVRGTFSDPDIDVDKGVLAAKAGGAVALGILAPVVTALLPLVNPGAGEDSSGCRTLLDQAKKAPAAPPPR